MALNQIPTEGYARQPRAIVKIEGEEVVCAEFEVDSNSFYQANTFRLTLPLSAQPPARSWSFWSETDAAKVEIFAGFPPDPENFTTDDLDLILVGETDEVDVKPVSDEVCLTGRDYTSRFIEETTTEKFQNLTASELVKQLAERRGLKADVTDTSRKLGTFLSQDNILLTTERTEWDLLTYAAQEEGYLLYVEGETVHFHPPPDESSEAYILNYTRATEESLASSNTVMIDFSRSLTLARDVVVAVRSWNQKAKKGFTQTARASKAKRTQSRGGTAQTYVATVPNLSQEEAIKEARRRLEEITAHEIRLNAELPGDSLIKTNTPIRVEGTGTRFDQVYFVDHLIRTYTPDRGYFMVLRAKNHSTESQVLA